MSVYPRTYRGFHGQLTPDKRRLLVITRYGLTDLFQSRAFFAFFLACFLPAVVSMIGIYLRYNLEVLAVFNVALDELITVDASYFVNVVQMPLASLAFVMILVVGPTLVSPDLRNGALPLYLSRPLHKRDYVLGKLSVLLILTSAITWIPGLVVFAFQAILAGRGWLVDNAHIPVAMILSSLVWTVSLSLTSLAISASVKWKQAARMSFLAIFFVSAAMGHVISQLFDTGWGDLFDVFDVLRGLVETLYGTSSGSTLSGLESVVVFAALALISLTVLHRRIRAREMVS